jgi:hypothetical protein
MKKLEKQTISLFLVSGLAGKESRRKEGFCGRHLHGLPLKDLRKLSHLFAHPTSSHLAKEKNRRLLESHAN